MVRYPLPPVFTVIEVTTSLVTAALAVAPVPAPVIVTVGALVYPEPPSITVIEVITPALTVASASAPIPPPPVIATLGPPVFVIKFPNAPPSFKTHSLTCPEPVSVNEIPITSLVISELVT